MLLYLFLVHFSVGSVWWTKLATRQLFTARYTIVLYRIISKIKRRRAIGRKSSFFHTFDAPVSGVPV